MFKMILKLLKIFLVFILHNSKAELSLNKQNLETISSCDVTITTYVFMLNKNIFQLNQIHFMV